MLKYHTNRKQGKLRINTKRRMEKGARERARNGRQSLEDWKKRKEYAYDEAEGKKKDDELGRMDKK